MLSVNIIYRKANYSKSNQYYTKWRTKDTKTHSVSDLPTVAACTVYKQDCFYQLYFPWLRKVEVVQESQHWDYRNNQNKNNQQPIMSWSDLWLSWVGWVRSDRNGLIVSGSQRHLNKLPNLILLNKVPWDNSSDMYK